MATRRYRPAGLVPEVLWPIRHYGVHALVGGDPEDERHRWVEVDDAGRSITFGTRCREYLSTFRSADDVVAWLAGRVAAYLPPAHRRQLAEAIGAGDFGEEGKGDWRRLEFEPPHFDPWLYCSCSFRDPPKVAVIARTVAEPPSHFSYWCGQCPRCGVIYWHRGAERRGRRWRPTYPDGDANRTVEGVWSGGIRRG